MKIRDYYIEKLEHFNLKSYKKVIRKKVLNLKKKKVINK
jgi:hypothetical protein